MIFGLLLNGIFKDFILNVILMMIVALANFWMNFLMIDLAIAVIEQNFNAGPEMVL